MSDIDLPLLYDEWIDTYRVHRTRLMELPKDDTEVGATVSSYLRSDLRYNDDYIKTAMSDADKTIYKLQTAISSLINKMTIANEAMQDDIIYPDERSVDLSKYNSQGIIRIHNVGNRNLNTLRLYSDAIDTRVYDIVLTTDIPCLIGIGDKTYEVFDELAISVTMRDGVVLDTLESIPYQDIYDANKHLPKLQLCNTTIKDYNEHSFYTVTPNKIDVVLKSKALYRADDGTIGTYELLKQRDKDLTTLTHVDKEYFRLPFDIPEGWSVTTPIVSSVSPDSYIDGDTINVNSSKVAIYDPDIYVSLVRNSEE